MKKVFKKLSFGIVLVLLMIAFDQSHSISAAELSASDAEILYVTGYEVTNKTITPGNDFTLTVTVHNFSTSVTASMAHVVITNPDGIIPEYGTLSEKYITDIKPGQDITVSFNYSSEQSVSTPYVNFKASITTANISTNSELRIPVGGTTDFKSENVTLPKSYAINKADYVSAMVTNVGTTGISNVVMVARCDGEEIAQSKIGTMAAGTNKTQSLSVSFTKEGQYKLDLVLTYVDSDGTNMEYQIASETINVSEDGSDNSAVQNITNADQNEAQTGNQQSGLGSNSIILICVCGFLLIAVCSVILILIYKRK